MQRMHEDDISSTILKFKMDYVHLMLPMEFEPERACETIIGFKDPRTYDGELLDPERMPRATVDNLKRDRRHQHDRGGKRVSAQLRRLQRPFCQARGPRSGLSSFGRSPAGSRSDSVLA